MICLVYLLSITLITSSKDRCGENYGKCDTGECCSRYGWCGTTEFHCYTTKGCQKNFGICKSGSSDSQFKPGEGKAEWVGFRFSEGGVKSSRNYGKIPEVIAGLDF
jgi:hypothetical protein